MLEREAQETVVALGVEVKTYLGAAIDLYKEAHAQLGALIAGLERAEHSENPADGHAEAACALLEHGKLMEAAGEGLMRYAMVKDCEGSA